MAEMITKPDVKPWLVALLNLMLPGAGGYIYLGQYKKALIFFSLTMVLAIVVFGLFFPIVGAIDGYLLAKKLEDGEAIKVDENSLEFLNAMFK